MKTPTHEEVAAQARRLWLEYGSPADRDAEIWLEAERQVTAGSTGSDDRAAHENSRTTTESKGASALADRITVDAQAMERSGGSISAPSSVSPNEQASKAATQRKAARAPKVAVKTTVKAPSPVSGKPLWDKPHSK